MTRSMIDNWGPVLGYGHSRHKHTGECLHCGRESGRNHHGECVGCGSTRVKECVEEVVELGGPILATMLE